ncbi:head-tail connector protein, partial [Hansschlegelia beijingensis]|uniref:head-tail connector protein n=1 Tax=Hansschlegelia beijingensis TaxID=1133344 RepID=UPI00387F2444
MPAVMLTAPEAEPIGLADAKAYLRLDHDHEDPLVQDLIAAAARQVEKPTRRVLIAQRWRLDVRLPCGEAI